MADSQWDNNKGINDSEIDPRIENSDIPHTNGETFRESESKDPRGTESPEGDLVTKLKKQNTKLRQELRVLSQSLTSIIEKQKAKRPEKATIDQDLARDELKRELDNAQKQIQIYMKDNKMLRSRMEFTGNDRVSALENQLREKERAMEKLVDERKTLEKIKRDQEKQLNQMRDDRESFANVTAYTEEIRHLKQKLREVEEKEQKNERTAQKKHEYYLTLEQKYRDAVQQNLEPVSAGVGKRNGSMDRKGYLSRREDVKPDLRTFHTRSDMRLNPKSKNRQLEDDSPKLTEDNMRELQSTIKILKKAHLTNEKKHKMELEILQNRIRDLEFDLKETTLRLREKEKESNIMNSKMNEMKRTIKTSLLPPLEEELERNNRLKLNSTNKKSTSITKVAGSVRKDERGKASPEDQEFTDQDLLKDVKNPKICGIKLWYSNTNITGLQAFYRDPTGLQIEGTINVSASMKSKYREEYIDLTDNDHVKEICGFLDRNEKYIQAFIITSLNGESRRVGNSTPDSKLFKLDINEYEYPSMLYGAIELEYDDDEGDKECGSMLTKIGVVIRADEIEERIETKEDEDKKRSKGFTGQLRKSASKHMALQATKQA